MRVGSGAVRRRWADQTNRDRPCPPRVKATLLLGRLEHIMFGLVQGALAWRSAPVDRCRGWCRIGDAVAMSSPDAAPTKQIARLVGVYDAGSTLRGELSCWVGARLGQRHIHGHRAPVETSTEGRRIVAVARRQRAVTRVVIGTGSFVALGAESFVAHR